MTSITPKDHTAYVPSTLLASQAPKEGGSADPPDPIKQPYTAAAAAATACTSA